MAVVDKKYVKDLIQRWNERGEAACYRNDLRELARNAGLTLEDFIEHVFSENKQETEKPLMTFAQQIWAEGYRGEFMKDPEDACRWIHAMARGVTDEFDIPEAGHKFWKIAKIKYGMWCLERENGAS